MKNIFHHYLRAFNKANKIFFLKGESPTLKVKFVFVIDV